MAEPADAALGHVLKAAAVVLEVLSVDKDDNFFDLGGNSIGAIELCSEIERTTGFETPLEMVWDTDSFADLARAIAPLLPASAPAGVAGASPGDEAHPR